ncbi:hypothetical protein FD29_GL001032 [Companilactobacillus mindensis DSM 14500]|jgi:hypothetical protein|uniref:Uncharacterized protein n=1 Tax=Companilactobacillus mindensis DSM 14500 TaxID=1423770 RepID=A0A0R1QQB1_9LACO|nr:hypothetical protein [Companilactobacillus mindensis]KRL43347.1 hypothetical protein FD29_GL001032 [Companilactobacillus mindensis DSM 14500]GEO79824.1 hypothetical protein LMI01_21550 [Companilactobacillus mindensis]
MAKEKSYRAPKIILTFIVGQMALFVSSKAFRITTAYFLDDAVSDVVDLAYKKSHEKDK